MIINQKLLFIPPYLSTSWSQVVSLSVDERGVLLVNLKGGLLVPVPHLSTEILHTIFALHGKYIEKEEEQSHLTLINGHMLPKDMLTLFGAGNLLDLSSPFLQHDPSKADAPKLPEEVLNKLSQLSKKLGPIDADKLSPAEPHCNCPHCQIVRAIISGNEPEEVAEEEIVTDEDLRFQNWKISKASDNLYVVTNPLDTHENYTVYLGNPVGCTCGARGCEHLKAVLQS